MLTPVDERFNRCLAGHCCWAWPAAEDSQWWQLMNRSCGAAQPLFCTPSAVRAPLRLPQLQSAAALAVVGCSRPPLACSGPRAQPTQHTHENRGLSANLFESQGGVVHDTVRHCIFLFFTTHQCHQLGFGENLRGGTCVAPSRVDLRSNPPRSLSAGLQAIRRAAGAISGGTARTDEKSREATRRRRTGWAR